MQLFEIPNPLKQPIIVPQKHRRDNIRTMTEKDAKAIYKSLYKKTLTVKQGSHWSWLYYRGNLYKSFIQSSPEITKLFTSRGYDLDTAFDD